MKKIFYAMMIAVLPVMAMSLSSCDNDDNMPNVNIALDVQNGTVVDNTIYVVQGDTLNIEGIQVTNNDQGKGAAITNVRYYINGFFIGQAYFSPFPVFELTDADTQPGKFELGVTCTVLAVDKSIATASLTYPVVVVASADEIPGGSSAVPANEVSKSVSLKP